MDTIKATVRAIGAPSPSKFGTEDRRPVNFDTANGPVTQWFSASKANKLKPGYEVTLIPNSQGGYQVADITAAPAAALTPHPSPLATAPVADRESRRKYAAALARQYSDVFAAVQDTMLEYSLPDVCLKDISTSIFIQIIRHFNL